MAKKAQAVELSAAEMVVELDEHIKAGGKIAMSAVAIKNANAKTTKQRSQPAQGAAWRKTAKDHGCIRTACTLALLELQEANGGSFTVEQAKEALKPIYTEGGHANDSSGSPAKRIRSYVRNLYFVIAK